MKLHGGPIAALMLTADSENLKGARMLRKGHCVGAYGYSRDVTWKHKLGFTTALPFMSLSILIVVTLQ